jgi:glutamyl-tRNA reductase
MWIVQSSIRSLQVVPVEVDDIETMLERRRAAREEGTEGAVTIIDQGAVKGERE